MTDRAALVAAVEADPDSDLPRLVWADWLDDHGEPERAELIRVQCELAARPSDPLKHLQRRLLDTLSERWPQALLGDWQPSSIFPDQKGPFDQYRDHFKRGVLTHLMPDAAEFVARVDAYHSHGEPVCDLILWHWPCPEQPTANEWLPDLVMSPHLSRVGSVGGRVPAGVFRSPHLSRLSVVATDNLDTLHELSASPSPFVLRKLRVGHTTDGPDPDEWIAVLAASPRLTELESLTLNPARVRRHHIRALAGSRYLPRTLSLVFVNGPSLSRWPAENRLLAERFPGPPPVG